MRGRRKPTPCFNAFAERFGIAGSLSAGRASLAQVRIRILMARGLGNEERIR